MFMCDSVVWEDLIEKYNLQDVDISRVGYHDSKEKC